MLRARDLGRPPGPYVLQAAIAVCHAQARRAEDTDWAQIATLYDALVQAAAHPDRPTEPGGRHRHGLAARPRDWPWSTRSLTIRCCATTTCCPACAATCSPSSAEVRRPGWSSSARPHSPRNATEQAFLRRRAEEIPAPGPAGPTLGQAVAEFLAGSGRGDRDARTGRPCTGWAGPSARNCLWTTPAPTGSPGPFEAAWGAQPRRRGTGTGRPSGRSAAGRGAAIWPAGSCVDWRRAAASNPSGRPCSADCWHQDLPLRDRTLWRLLYESAAPVTAVLSLNVEDLDLADRRARAGQRWVTWRAGARSFAARADRRAQPRPTVSHRPTARPGRGGAAGRPLSGDRPAAAVLRARRVPVQAGDPAAGPGRRGVHATPAPIVHYGRPGARTAGFVVQRRPTLGQRDRVEVVAHRRDPLVAHRYPARLSRRRPSAGWPSGRARRSVAWSSS